MGRNTSDDLEDAHNKGQSDGAKNDYSPPVPLGPLTELTTPESTLNEWRELNDAYDKGWDNGYKSR